MTRIHILNAHQKWAGIAEGGLNKFFVDLAVNEIAKHQEMICTVTNIEDVYDIASEVELLANADLIIVQFPMYWMSLPWLAKKYIDEVFMAGYGRIYANDGRAVEGGLYGSGGMLSGKYMLSITCNAPVEAFNEKTQFFHGLGVDDAFIAVHNAFKFVGLKQLPTFVAHNVVKDPQIVSYQADFIKQLDFALSNI